MSVERLELSTNGLKGRCSAIELHAHDATFYHAPSHASTDYLIFVFMFSEFDTIELFSENVTLWINE